MQISATDTGPGAIAVSRGDALLVWLGRVARHRFAQTALCLLSTLVLWRRAGRGALSGWAVGLGMDEQRGALVAALLIVLATSGAVTMLGGRPGPARAGGLLGLAAVEVGPFLVSAARSPSTGGLATTAVPVEWVAQPLGMLLLGWIAVTLGAAAGALVRDDLLALGTRLRRGVRAWPPVLAGAALVALVAMPAAATALQDGSVAALYSYATTPDAAAHPSSAHGQAHPGVVATVKGAAHAPAGHLERLVVGRRAVDVYLPATYALNPATSFPVVYFLHGYPSTETQWLSGAQLPGVLDQLIATRVVPPLLAVLPDGNGQTIADAEWGDTSRGDRIETWLVDSAVPAIDARYRTLGAHFRGIAGLSSGGYGALNIAIRHPGVFGWAASYSGYFTARRDLFRGPAAAANSPALTVSQIAAQARMPLYIGVGTGDGRYLDANEAFNTELRRLGWEPVSFDVVPGGHGWAAWRLQLVHSMEWLGTLWPAPPPERTPAAQPVE